MTSISKVDQVRRTLGEINKRDPDTITLTLFAAAIEGLCDEMDSLRIQISRIAGDASYAMVRPLG